MSARKTIKLVLVFFSFLLGSKSVFSMPFPGTPSDTVEKRVAEDFSKFAQIASKTNSPARTRWQRFASFLNFNKAKGIDEQEKEKQWKDFDLDQGDYELIYRQNSHAVFLQHLHKRLAELTGKLSSEETLKLRKATDLAESSGEKFAYSREKNQEVKEQIAKKESIKQTASRMADRSGSLGEAFTQRRQVFEIVEEIFSSVSKNELEQIDIKGKPTKNEGATHPQQTATLSGEISKTTLTFMSSAILLWLTHYLAKRTSKKRRPKQSKSTG